MDANQNDRRPMANDLQERETFAKMMWLGGIFSFFGIQAVIWTIAIALTHADPSHAVAPGYADRGSKWESTREQVAASRALGWQAELTTVAAKGGASGSIVEIRLVDNAGQPITDAQVDIRAFHRARAALAQERAMTATAPGIYTALFDLSPNGHWQFEIKATRGADVYFETVIAVVGNSQLTK